MQTFKFHTYIHLFNIFLILLPSSMYILIKRFFKQDNLDVILLIFTVFAVYNFIKYLRSYYIAGDKSLVKKELLNKKEISWEEVEYINVLPSSRGSNYVISVYGNSKEILISYWINNYHELIRIIVKENMQNSTNKPCIDPLIFEIINN